MLICNGRGFRWMNGKFKGIKVKIRGCFLEKEKMFVFLENFLCRG